MTELATQTWWMTQRRLQVFVQQPAYLIITLIQPVIWLFLFGSLFKRVAELPGFAVGSYLDYLVPGVVVMSAVSSNMWAGMGVLEEIERGTMNRFLITPVHRSAITNAAVVEQAVSTAIQSSLIVALGYLGGARYAGGVLGVTVLVVVSIFLGTVFGGLSNAVGMLVRERETIIALNIFLLLPLTFVSSAFMAESLMPAWMQNVADFNPLNWSLDAARAALSAGPDWSTVATSGGLVLALAVVMVTLSTRTFRAYQRAV